eukprot:3380298-Rhodomonas_salina.2
MTCSDCSCLLSAGILSEDERGAASRKGRSMRGAKTLWALSRMREKSLSRRDLARAKRNKCGNSRVRRGGQETGVWRWGVEDGRRWWEWHR